MTHNNKKNARVIAFYLPQFHPIPENDKWWGKGFTEWTNVGKAKPYFKGHYQPKVPSDLGYYDLRVPETRQAQADMAKEYGVEGFAYWHYWFGNGKRLLERPFNEVLTSGEPNFPFCLAWANTSWKGFDYGVKGRKTLISQEYPGTEDHEKHFNEVLPAFHDPRYIRIEDKPIFIIFAPHELPKTKEFIELWQNLAIKNGLNGIHFIAQTNQTESIHSYLQEGYNSVNIIRLTHIINHKNSLISRVRRKLLYQPLLYKYQDAMKYFTGPEDYLNEVIPTIIPNWDHSPRTGKKGYILDGSNPALFGDHVKKVLQSVSNKPLEKKIVFLKSWNEWAEGNYMEPDLKFGHGYLKALRECLLGKNS